MKRLLFDVRVQYPGALPHMKGTARAYVYGRDLADVESEIRKRFGSDAVVQEVQVIDEPMLFLQ